MLTAIEQAAGKLDRSSAAFAYAMAVARGVGCDDPKMEYRGVTAVWFQGRLYSLEVSDEYANADPVKAGRVINAVIIQAYFAWRAAFDRAVERASEELGL